MSRTLARERAELARIEAEYRRYKATQMIVDKADIELLDQLYSGKIFWTKKLEAMARNLPENYWITMFRYKDGTCNVKGYGYITEEQRQLITIDDYLNLLRQDRGFNDVLKNVHFNLTERNDEPGRERVTFDYSAEGGKNR
jgi:Tfp pilus assembly protein PilN